ncbi:PRD domain-containing protein [Ectobacillus funiculus]|uniref:BglG family transcription antiterminator LicT n=1 Tax=Ectobacillus funiculus TaxID=137993 RepID=UPI00397CAA65
MQITRVLNNNTVLCEDEKNNELIVIGRGLAFQKRPGDYVDQEKIEKKFSLMSKEASEKFTELVISLPIEYLELSEEIIQKAKMRLGKKLNETIYISLTDHLHFAVQRLREGIFIENGLAWEIKHFYPEEFELGMEAIKMINEKFEISLPQNEAANIALHLVNAQLNETMTNMVEITKVIKKILTIVRYNFNIEFDENSLKYFRFLTHLKFFSQRMINGKIYKEVEDNELFHIIRDKYNKAFKCTTKIQEFVKENYDYELSQEELLYLTIHIERVMKNE